MISGSAPTPFGAVKSRNSNKKRERKPEGSTEQPIHKQNVPPIRLNGNLFLTANRLACSSIASRCGLKTVIKTDNE